MSGGSRRGPHSLVLSPAHLLTSPSAHPLPRFVPPPGSGYSVQKTAALLEQFDRHVAEGRAALAAATDEEMDVEWTMKAAGQVVDRKSRYLMLRTGVLNHLVHHRAQLGVYLRLVDVPVPSMYGPTADTKATPNA